MKKYLLIIVLLVVGLTGCLSRLTDKPVVSSIGVNGNASPGKYTVYFEQSGSTIELITDSNYRVGDTIRLVPIHKK